MRIPAILAALALTALAPSALHAHIELTASAPAAGSATKAPKAVTLTFSQPVDPSRSVASIVMTAMPGMANHGEMLIRNFTASWSPDGRTMTLTLKKALPTGSYEVRWQAVGNDGHPMKGAFTFAVS